MGGLGYLSVLCFTLVCVGHRYNAKNVCMIVSIGWHGLDGDLLWSSLRSLVDWYRFSLVYVDET